MPVEIRELVIRAVVTEQQQPSGSGEPVQYGDEVERNLLIQECVQEVMKQLDKSRER